MMSRTLLRNALIDAFDGFISNLPLYLRNKPAFQPLFKNLRIHRDVFKQPVVTDVVEAALNVTLKYPFWGFLLVQVGEALLNSVMGASADSESIGVGVSIGFRLHYIDHTVQPSSLAALLLAAYRVHLMVSA